MAINGQVGYTTNLSDQNGSSVLSFEELGHGSANNYLPNRKGKFLIADINITSSVASASITTGFSQSNILDIDFIAIKPQNDGDELAVRFYESGVEESAAVYDRAYRSHDTSNSLGWQHSSNDNEIPLSTNVGNATGEMYSGMMTLFNHNNSSMYTTSFSKGNVLNSAGTQVTWYIAGELPQSSQVDGIKLFFSTGNIESGKIKIYGYA